MEEMSMEMVFQYIDITQNGMFVLNSQVALYTYQKHIGTGLCLIPICRLSAITA